MMDWLELLMTCDCLGCINDALRAGTVSQEDVDEYFDVIEAERRQREGVCPACGNRHAYISEYEPSMMHCGQCGVYSACEEFTGGPWTPIAQGVSHT